METLDKEKQKSEPMNVLHVFGRMVRGGAEMRTLELMRHIDKKKCRFYFCALSGLPGELDEEICSLGGEVFHIKFNPLFFWRLRKVCHFYHIDVVHSHVHYFSGLILYFGKLLKVPVRVAHFRSMQDGREKSIRRRMQNRLMKFLINRHATNILAVSEGAMVSAWGEDWKADTRCRVIYNGLDIAGFGGIADCEGVRMDLGLPRDARLFIHVGRMTRAKNHVRLLSIFKNISDCDADAFLLLVGRRLEPIDTIIQKLVDEFKISQKVVCVGERADVPRLLKASNVMIFPSLWEGLPGAVLESYAAGTPVLANDLPGIREIVVRLPKQACISLLSLDKSDHEWAASAINISQKKSKWCPEFEVNTIFNNTVFDFEICTDSFYGVWRDSGGANE